MKQVLIATLLLALAGCSSNQPANPAPTQPAAKKTSDAITGREAFQRLYVTARGWSPDARPFQLQSGVTKDAAGHDGRAPIWRASFASPARQKQQPFQWSGAVGPDAGEPGISHGTEDSYSPTNSSTQVFDPLFLKIDSDAAYQTALKHGGEKLVKATPDIPVTYRLGWDPRQNELHWRVAFGKSSDSPDLAVDVNASTGEFMRTEK